MHIHPHHSWFTCVAHKRLANRSGECVLRFACCGGGVLVGRAWIDRVACAVHLWSAGVARCVCVLEALWLATCAVGGVAGEFIAGKLLEALCVLLI